MVESNKRYQKKTSLTNLDIALLALAIVKTP